MYFFFTSSRHFNRITLKHFIKMSQETPSPSVCANPQPLKPLEPLEPLKPIKPIKLLKSGIARYEDHRGKAKMLIFNQINFDDTNLKERQGSGIDGNDLKATFKRFGFDVVEYENLTKNDIFKEMAAVAKDLKCIAVVVLSHGGNGKIWAKDIEYEEKEMLEYFEKNTDLKGVPKLFIFQICRKKTTPSDKETFINLSLSDKDMIVLHSTYFNEFSQRDPNEGSWFIQTLCQRLNLMKTENLLLDEMTFVMRDLSLKYQGKQMPVILYNTKKHFYLSPNINTVKKRCTCV